MENNLESSQTSLYSILIPTYNRAQYLGDAIDSVLRQKYNNLELVIVDDGSTDNTADVVQKFDDPRIRYIPKEHSGAPATRNRCIEEARGEFILWLDSDDVLLDDTLNIFHQHIANHPELDVLYGDLIIVDTNLNPQNKLSHQDWYGRNDELIASMLLSNSIPNPGSMIRKSLFETYGGYSEEFPRAHDYEFWTRIAPHATFKKVNHPTLLWRWHSNNMSTGSVNFNTSFEVKILKNLLKQHTYNTLFPHLEWATDPNNESAAIANIQIANRMLELGHPSEALPYLEHSIAELPLPETMEMLSKVQEMADRTLNIKQTKSFPLKILFVVHNFMPEVKGGAEIYTYHIAKELQRLGHEVHITLPSRIKNSSNQYLRSIYDGLQVWHINHQYQTLLDEFHNEKHANVFDSLLKRIKPDVVHVQHLIGFSGSILQKVKEQNIPLLFTMHDGWFACEQYHFLENGEKPCINGPETIDKCVHCFRKRTPSFRDDEKIADLYYNFAQRRHTLLKSFQFIDEVMIPTSFLKSKMEDSGFIHPRMSVYRMGLNHQDIKEKVKRNGRVRFGLLGNIFRTKGQDLAVEAIKRFSPEEVELNIFGGIGDRKYFDKFQSSLPRDYKIRLHGSYNQEDLPAIFSKIDVCLVPSRSENYPLVIRESLHSKTPIIASRVGGIPEMIHEEQNGVLFEPENVDDLFSKMSHFVYNQNLIENYSEAIEAVLSIQDDVKTLESKYYEHIRVNRNV